MKYGLGKLLSKIADNCCSKICPSCRHQGAKYMCKLGGSQSNTTIKNAYPSLSKNAYEKINIRGCVIILHDIYIVVQEHRKAETREPVHPSRARNDQPVDKAVNDQPVDKAVNRADHNVRMAANKADHNVRVAANKATHKVDNREPRGPRLTHRLETPIKGEACFIKLCCLNSTQTDKREY